MMNNKNLCIYFVSSLLTIRGSVGQVCSLDWVCVWQILSEGLLSPLANEKLELGIKHKFRPFQNEIADMKIPAFLYPR